MDETRAYREEGWEELIGGRVAAMAPAATNHNMISGNIYHLFRSYLKGKKCVPFGDGEKVFLTATDHYVPDFMIVCDRDKIQWDGVHGAPDLVVEVLSPGTAKYDKGRKKTVYESSGVPEYWLVSPTDRSVEVHRLQGGRYVLDNIYQLYPPYMLEAMSQAEKAALVTRFQCHLYDDLAIDLDDIFSGLFSEPARE